MKRNIEAPGFTMPGVEDITRRDFLIGGAAAILLGGCGGGGSEESASGGTRVIEHKYGSTEITGAPERVVTVGLTDQDPVLALGAAPVAVREWYGEYPYATWPWAQDELGDATPEVLPAAEELNFEQIATFDADLIVGISSGMTGGDYETLSRIAPTIAQSGEYVDYGVPWQEQTSVIGRALGREERAKNLVAGIEARFARAREKHPEFEGASGVTSGLGVSGSEGDALTPSVHGSQDNRARFLISLGFEIPDKIAELAGDEFYASLSLERLDLIDTDVLVWLTQDADDFEAVKDEPLYQRLNVAQEGRDIFLAGTLASALSFGTVLSLPFALDKLVPILAAAIDGDPETRVEGAS